MKVFRCFLLCVLSVCESPVPLNPSFPVVQLIAVQCLGSGLFGWWSCSPAHRVLVDRGVGLGCGVVSRRTAVGLAAVVTVSVVHRAVMII